MGKCSNCGKKIKYNQFKIYRDKILCYDCYDTRLERKKTKRKAAEEKVKKDSKTMTSKSLTEDLSLYEDKELDFDDKKSEPNGKEPDSNDAKDAL